MNKYDKYDKFFIGLFVRTTALLLLIVFLFVSLLLIIPALLQMIILGNTIILSWMDDIFSHLVKAINDNIN